MRIRSRTITGGVVAALGLLLAFVEFGLYFRAHYLGLEYRISPYVLLAATVLAFVGGFIVDSRKAEDAGTFLADTGLKFITLIRTGRRTSDVVAVVSDTPPAPLNAPLPPDRPVPPPKPTD